MQQLAEYWGVQGSTCHGNMNRETIRATQPQSIML
jgi:hypothetical protein